MHPASGWTELVVTPERGVRAVDGLLTGWHEPEATHLLMLEAIAGRPALERAYARGPRAAVTCGTSSATATCCSRSGSMTRANGSRPTLPEGRRAVLYALRRRGQATADDIARQLDMTVSGARQHLTALVDDGLRRGDRAARGPPGQRGRAAARVHA